MWHGAPSLHRGRISRYNNLRHPLSKEQCRVSESRWLKSLQSRVRSPNRTFQSYRSHPSISAAIRRWAKSMVQMGRQSFSVWLQGRHQFCKRALVPVLKRLNSLLGSLTRWIKAAMINRQRQTKSKRDQSQTHPSRRSPCIPSKRF